MEIKSPEELIGHELSSEGDCPVWFFDVNCPVEEKDVGVGETDSSAAKVEAIFGQAVIRISRRLAVRGGLIRSLGESAHKIVRSVRLIFTILSD